MNTTTPTKPGAITDETDRTTPTQASFDRAQASLKFRRYRLMHRESAPPSAGNYYTQARLLEKCVGLVQANNRLHELAGLRCREMNANLSSREYSADGLVVLELMNRRRWVGCFWVEAVEEVAVEEGHSALIWGSVGIALVVGAVFFFL